jgi:predicted nucleic acid-binding Zn ribbon protein
MPSAAIPSESERAASSAPVIPFCEVIRPCPVCGQAMTGRQTSACSNRCRAAKNHRKQLDALAIVEDQLTRALTRVGTLRGTRGA